MEFMKITIGKPILDYSQEELNLYRKKLGLIGALSNLFSNSTSPFIQYRTTENIYCSVFKAKNISRTDCPADAIRGKTGIGIKTFLENSHYQKIAEFNKEAPLYRNLEEKEKVMKIASLRNERIAVTMRTYALDKMIYHCIIRAEQGRIYVFEELMHAIDIDSIKIISSDENSIVFSDKFENYRFYYPKSTLFKAFDPNNVFLKMNIDIIKDPLELIEEALGKMDIDVFKNMETIEETPTIILPLHSHNSVRGNFVAEKSGLNQWNARGRPRNPDEVYIPYPKSLHNKYPAFFPPRDQPFTMLLPDGKTIKMKICQEGDKALMSNPNKDLGKWLLRDVLALKPNELLTYDKLLECGIDSVIIKKMKEGVYSMDFYRSDS